MRLRIAHITATFPPYYSGTGMVCWHNAIGLARLGHDVTVITAAHPPGNYEYPQEIKVRRLPVAFRIGNAPFLLDLLRLRDFDVIHLHHPFIFGTELVCTVARARGIPLVITHHNDLVGDGLRPLLFDTYSAISLPLLFTTAKKFIAVSLDHARGCRLAPRFERRWNDVVEIPNGVDTNLFRSNGNGKTIRAQQGISDDAFVVLFVGALDRAHHFRRVDLLLKACQQLHDPRLCLIIVGDGDRAEEYKQLAYDLGIAQNTRFLGRVAHDLLPDIYNGADLVVLPSHIQESFGMVLIEAMACGKPVIGSNLPGVRSVISHSRDGLITEPGNVEHLSESLRLLMEDMPLRQEMGKHGKDKAHSRYSWNIISRLLEDVYLEILQQPSTLIRVKRGEP